MNIYIRGTGNISPQITYGDVPFLNEAVEYCDNRLTCIEPDYKDVIDPKMIRRMSRIIKMGVASASVCLKDAEVEIPGAIVTGTAYGCLQDTDVFLTKMIEQNEELLTPTSFIQSTHNTIGAQIGLLLKSNNYNNTFVHRGFSFESALLDSIMYLKENSASTVLTGAIDEITDNSHAILSRFGLYKNENVSNCNLYKTSSKGTIAGEGAAFFLLANESSANDYAELNGVYTFYKPEDFKEIEKNISSFFASQLITIDDIDLVITGKNGNIKDDKVYTDLQKTVFNNIQLAHYKNLSGEYPTSAAFALWLAINIIKSRSVPAILSMENNSEKRIKKILIYNHYQNIHHSLFLISAC